MVVSRGLAKSLKEFSPISDYSTKKFQLEFTSFSLSESKTDESNSKINKTLLPRALESSGKLTNKILVR